MKPWVLLMFLVGVGGAAWADDPRGIESNQVAPVEELLKQVATHAPKARVLKVELEGADEDENEAHAEAVYEVKALTPEGSVVKLVFRARDLVLLKEQRPVSHHRGH